ncbi:MAG: ribulokinase [Candidatus Marinimicrobia bacterium]|nr:ribulokinase [Candidatus Neomarinimicrobiota bacterium]MCF7827866.1 ribulokinase [Candidatus Neomarinimicrobiota bacterium]MCF7879379.1 ribulokinase [Candidatus Neomarinimicrobiota bacterium]
MKNSDYVIGLDYGTDSVRAIIVDTDDGKEIATAVSWYKQWQDGKYCAPEDNQFRQHPQDYIDGLESSITEALKKAPDGTAERIRGISIDTTGSTPVAVDRKGTPLALLPEFRENPNAMFILWKDHTGIQEAEEINETARTWGGIDYTHYEGGIYSSEWFWSKILHTMRHDEKVREAAYSWVEHCDWMPALLTGNTDPLTMKRSRCAAGHKAMWHESWGGLPPDEFLHEVDPLLEGLPERLYGIETYTADISAGTLTPDWAERLGLSEDVVVGVGAFDAHLGAVGVEIKPHILCKVMGTSTCDMMIIPPDELGDTTVQGIAGQVDGSILPGMVGLEAGQSAFGDIYAWFQSVLMWPVEQFADSGDFAEKVENELIPALTDAAEKEPIDESGVVATDWMNGRRTPDANQRLKGAITRLNLGSSAPKIFRGLVESTAFGAKAIADRFESEGARIDGIIALGGIPKKSPFIMQVVADVHNQSIKVASCDQAPALGSAMAAAAAAGIYDSIEDAQDAMGWGFDEEYHPIPENVEKYRKLFERYKQLGEFIENDFTY